MKNIASLSVILLTNIFCSIAYAQVSTPSGTSVDYLIGTYNATNAASAENQAANWLSARGWTNDVIKTVPATGEYNCHSYAWYRSEGGTGNYWINAFTNADLDGFHSSYYYPMPPTNPKNIKRYWEDGSYVEVSESEATKVWYGSSSWTWNNGWINSYDHSAIRITSGAHAGKYESKWGAWPRYIHPANKSPYSISNRKYYKKNPPALSGPTLVLNAGSTYTLSRTSGASVTWTYSSNLQKQSSSGASATFKPFPVSYPSSSDGLGWIKASVNGTSIPRYEVWVGKPVITGIDGEKNVSSGQSASFTAQYNPKAAIPDNGFQWVLSPQNGNSLYGASTGFLDIFFRYGGYFQLVVRATNANGTGDYHVDVVHVQRSSSSSSLYEVYPNPVSDELTVSLRTQLSSAPILGRE